jgi:hypothetical protein
MKERDGLLALAVGIVLITAVVLGVLAFAPLDPFSSENDWEYQETTALESLHLSVDADVCDVEVSFGDLADSWVEVRMSIEGRSGYIAGAPEINYTVSSSLAGKNLSVSVVLDMETGPTVTYDESDIIVVIERSLPAFMEIELDVGDAVITVMDNATLSGATVHTDVGGLHVHLEEGGMAGDMTLISDVGSVNVDSADTRFRGRVGHGGDRHWEHLSGHREVVLVRRQRDLQLPGERWQRPSHLEGGRRYLRGDHLPGQRGRYRDRADRVQRHGRAPGQRQPSWPLDRGAHDRGGRGIGAHRRGMEGVTW